MLAHQPGDAAFQLTAENKPAVKDWLVAQGMDPARVEGMQDATLYKSYRFPSYLRQLKLRADYFPAYRKDDPPCSITMPSTSKDGLTASKEQTAAVDIPITPQSSIAIGSADGNAAQNETQAKDHQIPPPGSAMEAEPAALISFLASLMAQPVLTEARVVELIKEHLPRILIERLQLGEF